MRAFALDGADAVALLEADERLVVARLVADVALLLGADDLGAQVAHPEPSDDDDLFRHLRGLEESLAAPDDPALLRLLPNASADRELADEFRRLTEHELRADKIARLRRIWEQLSGESDEWRVPADEVMSVAAALTDVRLVIACRLGVEADQDSERLHSEIALAEHALETDAGEQLGIDPERVWLGMLYHALAWLQDSLIAVRDDEEAASE